MLKNKFPPLPHFLASQSLYRVNHMFVKTEIRLNHGLMLTRICPFISRPLATIKHLCVCSVIVGCKLSNQ